MGFLDWLRGRGRTTAEIIPPQLYFVDNDGTTRPVTGKVAEWHARATRSSFTQNLINSLLRDYTNVSDEHLARAYIQSVTAAACIQVAADLASSIPVQVVARGTEEVLEQHPLVGFVEDAEDLLWFVSVCQNIWGRAYLRKRRNRHGFNSGLEPVRPIDVEPIVQPDYAGRDRIVGYWVHNERDPVRVADMIDLPLFDPFDRLGGLSPLEFVLVQIGIGRNLSIHAANFFFNGARLSGILKMPGASPDEKRESERRFNAKHQGARNAWRVMATSSAEAGFESTQAAPEDLAMPELSGLADAAIARAFQIDPVLIGLGQASDPLSAQGTFKAIEANQIRSKTLPKVRRALKGISRQWSWRDFQPANLYTLAPDINNIEALSPVTSENVTLVEQLTASGKVTLNEARQRLGFPAYDGDNGEVVVISGVAYPVSQIAKVARENVLNIGFGAGMPSIGVPVLPQPSAEATEPRPENVTQTEPMTGIQVQNAIDTLERAAAGSLAQAAAVEILVALGFDGDRAAQMVAAQMNEATTTTEAPEPLPGKAVPPQLPERSNGAQLKELANWEAKVARSTPDVEFYLDALAGHPCAAFVRERLEARDAPDAVFWAARAWLETGAAPPFAQADEGPQRATRGAEGDLGFGFWVSFSGSGTLVDLRAQLVDTNPEIDWLHESEWHLSLCYAAEPQLTSAMVPFIEMDYLDIDMPFEVGVAGLDIWETHKGNCLVVLIEKARELDALQRALCMEFDNAGVPINDTSLPENYTPHITLAYGVPDKFLERDGLTYSSAILTIDNIQLVDKDGVFKAWRPSRDVPGELVPMLRAVADDVGATPEEFKRYWRHFDALQVDLGAAWLEWMASAWVGIKDALSANPETYTPKLPPADDLIQQWLGTVDEPGPYMQLFLAGAAAGVDALETETAADYRSVTRQADIAIDWELVNQNAYEFARQYIFEWLPEINAKTERQLRQVIVEWIESGAPMDDLVDTVERIFHDRERAKLIAQTEGLRAYNEGAYNRYEAAGVTQATWQTVTDEFVCPICKPLHGVVGEFRAGWVHPGGPGKGAKYKGQVFRHPAHPGCRCFSRPKVR
jgi:HK97 family phage portal protein